MIAIRSSDAQSRSSSYRIDVSRRDRRHRGNFARGKAGEGALAVNTRARLGASWSVIVSFVHVELAAEAPPHLSSLAPARIRLTC